MARSIDGGRIRARTGVRFVGIAVLTLVLAGCQAVVESLAEESDPRHVGFSSPTLRDFDAYGNEIPTTK